MNKANVVQVQNGVLWSPGKREGNLVIFDNTDTSGENQASQNETDAGESKKATFMEAESRMAATGLGRKVGSCWREETV